MLRTQNLKELAAVAGVENNEVVQQMPGMQESLVREM